MTCYECFANNFPDCKELWTDEFYETHCVQDFFSGDVLCGANCDVHWHFHKNEGDVEKL